MGFTRRRLSLFFALLVLGLLLALQYRTTQKMTPDIDIKRILFLSGEIKKINRDRERLEAQAENLRHDLAKGLALQGQELDKARLAAGFLSVTGPGVRVVLNDSEKVLEPGEDPNLYLVHDEDLLKVLNAARVGGAEALSVNGLRILATTEVTCAGTTILTGANKLVPPFVILAIGNPEELEKSLMAKGGIIEALKLWNLRVEIQKKPEIIIPGHPGGVQFNYAKPLKEGS